jgi:integrase
MPVKLTQPLVNSLRAGPRRLVLHDTERRGLALRVMPSGQKSWLFVYRPPGSRLVRKWRFSSPDTLSLTDARQRVKEFQRELDDGRDPALRQPAVTPGSVQREIEHYLTHAKISPRYKRECTSMLTRFITPAFGALPISMLTREQVRALHTRIGSQHPHMANRVLALLSAACQRAYVEGRTGANPCQGVARFREHAKERFLTLDEQARFHAALDTALSTGLAQPPAARKRRGRPIEQKLIPADPYAVAALRFLLLSGCRLSEVLSLRWSAVDPAGFLRLERSKTGRQVRPLGAAALELLQSLERVGPYVFPGRTPHRPLRSLAVLWAAVRHAAGLAGVRLHDLRHTYASNAAAEGLPLQVIGALLGHRRVETTARYSHLTDTALREAANKTAARSSPGRESGSAQKSGSGQAAASQ